MLKKTIRYEDYDGNMREEDFYFNISRAELTLMENSEMGGMKKRLERIVKAQDTPAIMEVLADLIRRAYGEKSLDGKRFIKSEELATAFEQTEAYSELLMELLSDENYAAQFLKDIMPAQIVKAAEEKGLLPAISSSETK